MVRNWNVLPGKVVDATNLTTFNKYLDEQLKHHSIQRYGTRDGKLDSHNTEQRTKKITAQEQAFRPSKPAPTMLPI